MYVQTKPDFKFVEEANARLEYRLDRAEDAYLEGLVSLEGLRKEEKKAELKHLVSLLTFGKF